MCLCEKVSTKPLAQAANKNTKAMLTKTGRLPFFLKYGFRSVSEGFKNFKQTLPLVEEVTVQKLIIGFCTVTSNHKVSKYWASADRLFLTTIIV